ncbi:MAG: DUF2784 domain-containing protein [Gemmatimonadota bacterium]|nr:MAG: DUF2784 domain-containing protein [Gemmatimonadota bacterium]
MLSRLAADALVVVHLTFIVFVVLGGFLVWRWPRLIWIHPPAAIWGGLIEFFHWTCPLTPLENRLRRIAGDAGFEGSFIEHYLVPVVYPPGLNRALQIALGVTVVLVNAAAYTLYFRRKRLRSGGHATG